MPNDYFAELYVAGAIAREGWNVYFPHRDKGFDFIISKLIDDSRWVVRPVQVKSKTPEADAYRPTYGYPGILSAVHPEMVLAIPYFTSDDIGKPCSVAYMPFSQIKRTPKEKRFRCWPAMLRDSKVKPRPKFIQFFDAKGIGLMEDAGWSACEVSDDGLPATTYAARVHT